MSNAEQRNGKAQSKASSEERDRMLPNGTPTGKTAEDPHYSEPEIDGTRGLPIDRGWAWVVLGAAMFYFFLFGGVRKNFGLFFVAFQKRFNSSASLTSLLTTLQSITISVSSLLVMTIGLHYLSSRTSIMIGGVLIATANVINALSTNIGILFASFGVLEAIGISMVHPPVTSVLGEYFNKKRGMANALAFSGASMGNLVFAPVMTSLFDNYGYTGTMFVVAGMLLNTCITGALMRPMSSFKKGEKNHFKNSEEREDESSVRESEMNKPAMLKITSHKHDFSSVEILPLNVSEIKETHVMLSRQLSYDSKRFPHESPLIPRQRTWSATERNHASRHRTVSDDVHSGHVHNIIESLSRSNVTLYTSTAGFCGSVVDVRMSVERTLSQTENPEYVAQQSCCFSCRENTSKVFKLLFDLSLFRNPTFPVFLLMAFLMVAGSGISIIMVAPHAKDIGLSSDQIGILLLIVGLFDLFGRVSLALIADKKFIKRTTILAVSGAIVGLTSQFLRFFTSFETMVFFSIIIGSFCGLYMALHAVILVDYLTLAKLKSCLGFTLLCHGLAMSVFFPVAGLIRDSTGTYVNSYHMLGCLLLMGSLIAVSLPYIHKAFAKTREPTV